MKEEEIKAEVEKIYVEMKVLEDKLHQIRQRCKHKKWAWGISTDMVIMDVRICEICGDVVHSKQLKSYSKKKKEYIEKLELRNNNEPIEEFNFIWKKTRRSGKKSKPI